MQNGPSKNADPRSKPPPPRPPPRSNNSPLDSGRSQRISDGSPSPPIRTTRPLHSPSPSSSSLPSKSPTPVPPPPPTRRFNLPPKQAPNSQPDDDSIDWANLSYEDKKVFFSWLDEFFIKFTGDDSFVPKDQTQMTPPASQWSVPSGSKDAVASVVGEMGQGPPVCMARCALFL